MPHSDLVVESRKRQGTSVQQTFVEVSQKVPFLAAGALALRFAVGTGGAVTVPTITELARDIQSTSVSWHCFTPARRSEEEALTPAEQLVTIQRTLSLTLSDLASTLRVSRPTIYKWLRTDATLHAQNIARIAEVFRAAKRWRVSSDGHPREFVRKPVVGGQSVVDMLSMDLIDINKLDGAYARIAEAMQRQRSSARVTRSSKPTVFAPIPDSVKEDNLIGEAGL